MIGGKSVPGHIQQRHLKRDKKKQQRHTDFDLFRSLYFLIHIVCQNQHKRQDPDVNNRPVCSDILHPHGSGKKHGQKLDGVDLGRKKIADCAHLLFSLFGNPKICRQQKDHGETGSQNG